jgi:hypothetical protein
MSDSSYDVYVHEGHLVEVHRGEHGTVAQIFGEDWNTQPMVQFHAPALASVSEPVPLVISTPKFAADPNEGLHTGLKISFAFVILLLFSVWLVLR